MRRTVSEIEFKRQESSLFKLTFVRDDENGDRQMEVRTVPWSDVRRVVDDFKQSGWRHVGTLASLLEYDVVISDE
jgi:hypothetical protein